MTTRRLVSSRTRASLVVNGCGSSCNHRLARRSAPGRSTMPSAILALPPKRVGSRLDAYQSHLGAELGARGDPQLTLGAGEV